MEIRYDVIVRREGQRYRRCCTRKRKSSNIFRIHQSFRSAPASPAATLMSCRTKPCSRDGIRNDWESGNTAVTNYLEQTIHDRSYCLAPTDGRWLLKSTFSARSANTNNTPVRQRDPTTGTTSKIHALKIFMKTSLPDREILCGWKHTTSPYSSPTHFSAAKTSRPRWRSLRRRRLLQTRRLRWVKHLDRWPAPKTKIKMLWTPLIAALSLRLKGGGSYEG